MTNLKTVASLSHPRPLFLLTDPTLLSTPPPPPPPSLHHTRCARNEAGDECFAYTSFPNDNHLFWDLRLSSQRVSAKESPRQLPSFGFRCHRQSSLRRTLQVPRFLPRQRCVFQTCLPLFEVSGFVTLSLQLAPELLSGLTMGDPRHQA